MHFPKSTLRNCRPEQDLPEWQWGTVGAQAKETPPLPAYLALAPHLLHGGGGGVTKTLRKENNVLAASSPA